mmetsp:Transcript_1976/g.5457  ORF Transcript_1976/g.5457 Transcript_1976/m.5457 type:complete len:271 (-) Transcript_1976:1614-2426(-)|eukprot:CAMPEP_0198119120 /NCGR_PEP_ID=MMETSP1442-20131203/24342_1 /TAXON_ID= /ORGANISM="Craspedostauros australis, Strain CCMP3328" /LENGTH=270 /DNA_ID=CAMNT_0043777525 /DNA_START=76 /DNA_END=888 /DNA_ORIENTATION=-
MGFILIDFKKRKEHDELRTMVPTLVKKLDNWINVYPNDGTPPTEPECSDLEDEKINELLAEFDEKAGSLGRVKDEVPDRRHLLAHNLNSRKGYLFYKFSDTVDALQDQAAKTMTVCLETLNQSVKELNSIIPTKDDAITWEFEQVVKRCEEYVTATYPEGVTGLDAYDDVLPEGIPSYADFLTLVKEKEESFLQANKDSVQPAIDDVKAKSKATFRGIINKAIENATAEMVADLSDDTLPYLGEAEMEELRAELIAGAKEYAESRLDKEE